MISTEYVKLMAAYTEWQNSNLLGAADLLTDVERREDRGAFFGSIHATLNHLLWGDQLWLHRLAGTPEPVMADIPGSVHTHEDWEVYKADRSATDHSIIDWSRRVTADDLTGEFGWFSGAIQAQVTRPKWALVIQLFNHGTHHRGQVHAMLTAAGARPSDTDIPFMASEHFHWPG
jgi:uncharacterized damage-inducible protein DinB